MDSVVVQVKLLKVKLLFFYIFLKYHSPSPSTRVYFTRLIDDLGVTLLKLTFFLKKVFNLKVLYRVVVMMVMV